MGQNGQRSWQNDHSLNNTREGTWLMPLWWKSVSHFEPQATDILEEALQKNAISLPLIVHNWLFSDNYIWGKNITKFQKPSLLIGIALFSLVLVRFETQMSFNSDILQLHKYTLVDHQPDLLLLIDCTAFETSQVLIRISCITWV